MVNIARDEMQVRKSALDLFMPSILVHLRLNDKTPAALLRDEQLVEMRTYA